MSANNEIFTPSAVRAVESQTALGPVGLEEDAHPLRPLSSHVESKTLSRRLKALLILAKPEITLMVVISAGVACLMASDALRVVVLPLRDSHLRRRTTRIQHRAIAARSRRLRRRPSLFGR
jgi:hypothetical protein